MNGSAHFVVGKCRDDTLDLPPVAESEDIARIAAVLGTCGGLQPGVVAEAVDQIRSLGEGDIGRVHEPH